MGLLVQRCSKNKDGNLLFWGNLGCVLLRPEESGKCKTRQALWNKIDPEHRNTNEYIFPGAYTLF
jgi:hypothetical protein